MVGRSSFLLYPYAVGQCRSITVDIHDSLNEGLRSLLRKIMTDAACDESIRVLARKFLRIGRSVRMRRAIGITFKGDCGHADGRSFGETLFQFVILRRALDQAETPAVDCSGHIDRTNW
jgi:hypothetical protein